MNKLKISKFKAFESDVEIPLNNKSNLLLYGENGAGKTSIYDAIKVIFFKLRIESSLSAQTPEDLEQLKNELWASYNNKNLNQDFELQIEDQGYQMFDTSPYQIFMIAADELRVENQINLQILLERCYFSIENVNEFCINHYQFIQTEVNSALAAFNENVIVDIDAEDDFNIKIVDNQKHLERKSDLKKYFNEAKLNLISILVLLNAALKSKDQLKSKLLVLDDFISSLDTSNRTFLIRYIFEKFNDSQILIFTHNISFYNLTMYIINEIDNAVNKWTFANAYEIDNIHKIYIKSEIQLVKNIKEDFHNMALPASAADIENIGNRIRKKFEVLLYEYSKLVMIGTVEDSATILDRITKGNPAYYKGKKETASDLLDALQSTLAEGNEVNLTTRLRNTISDYTNNDFGNFQAILRGLKLYQKVSMHPMSHGMSGMPTFTIREIEKSLELLERMEGFLKDMVNKNVTSV